MKNICFFMDAMEGVICTQLPTHCNGFC
jgi:hypothetical protein